MKALVDTPQFQRLRYIKQLGASNNVYMCTNHTRFEHSIGVARLAQRICEGIRRRQPSLPCSSKDILCVKLAGLLHDIGHGPFSHAFEVFVKTAFPAYFKTLRPDQKAIYDSFPQIPPNFSHEQVSLRQIDAALAHLGLEIDLDNLDAPLKEIGDNGGIDASTMRSFEGDGEVLTSRDFVFIKECIYGKPIPDIQNAHGGKVFLGRRGWEKEWMYDIVANRHSGLDVDKMDYFARDSRRSFGHGQVDEVVVEEAVVAWGDSTNTTCTLCREDGGDRPHPGKRLMICYPEKMVKATINFFNKRFELHSIVYHHKTTKALGHMVCDILCKADPYFRLSTAPYVRRRDNGKRKKGSIPISRAMIDPNAFLRLRDSIIEEIANSKDENMEEAAELAGRFLIRDLYKCIIWHCIDQEDHCDKALWEMTHEEIKERLLEFESGLHHDELGDDIVIDKFTMHHGQKDMNPIENVRIITGRAVMRNLKVKDSRDLPMAEKPKTRDYKAQTPIEQQQRVVCVFCRTKANCTAIERAFREWIEVQKTQGSAPKILSQQTPIHYRSEDESVDMEPTPSSNGSATPRRKLHPSM